MQCTFQAFGSTVPMPLTHDGRSPTEAPRTAFSADSITPVSPEVLDLALVFRSQEPWVFSSSLQCRTVQNSTREGSCLSSFPFPGGYTSLHPWANTKGTVAETSPSFSSYTVQYCTATKYIPLAGCSNAGHGCLALPRDMARDPYPVQYFLLPPYPELSN